MLGCAAPLVLAGCAVSTQVEDTATPARVQGATISGLVHGGQQPVSGSTVTLYAAGSGTDGGSATALVSAMTGSNGTFIFPNTYTCTSNQQLYAVAAAGNSGYTNNPQLSLMTALGACSTISSSTNITINELTTVAAVFALTNYQNTYTFITSASSVGSTTGHATAMASAFTLAGQLVNTSSGTVPSTVLPAEANTIYTLGDILASCVNSAGGTANGTACGTLFTDATPYNGTAASNTISAALQIAANTNQNVTTLFGLAASQSPFQPVLTAAPADWSVALLTTGTKRILFVGDSFTHGRYSPARNYNSANMTDENYDVASTSSRVESTSEPGPYGGIPGIFKMLTTEGTTPVSYDVHIFAISSTSLANLYGDGTAVIANPQWDDVVLQELSYLPLTSSLSGNSSSHPATFCNSVKTVEQGVHGVNSAANIYLYETWARADETHTYATNNSQTFANALTTLFTGYHNVYYQAASASNDSNIAGVAPAGDAWLAAMNAGYLNETDPYSYTYTGSISPFLWFLYVSGSSPSTSSTAPDYLHPSIYGAYLNALVLYDEITGKSSAALGGSETAAAALGISSTLAAELQSIADSQVASGSKTYTGTPCSSAN